MPQQRQQAGVIAGASPKTKAKGERPALNIVLRSFGGVNQFDAIEAINDNEFYWLEEIGPESAGRLLPCKGIGAVRTTVAGETGAPSYTADFEVAGVQYGFAVWKNTGNGWVGLSSGGAWTKIFNGTLTSGQTAACAWDNLGLLVVDPTAGYHDWNVTTAATLTNLSGQLDNPVIAPGTVGVGFTDVTIVDTGGGGSGGSVGFSVTCFATTILAAGTGYVTGDVLTFHGGSLTTDVHAPITDQNQPTTLLVTSVDNTGKILAISIQNAGAYQVAPPGAPGGIGTVTLDGGTGTGATCNAAWEAVRPFIITPGVGYVTPTAEGYHIPLRPIPWFTVGTSGTLLGSSIAAYAGRVWIGVKRTVQFTDIDSYNAFGGAGGSFTITDDWLKSDITALFAANNYLYIFGVSSVDILSNVQVGTGDLTSFSRINASAAVGSDQPASIFAYSRTVVFANSVGFFMLSGATPQMVSEKLTKIISLGTGAPVWGGLLALGQEYCPAILFTFNDTIIGLGTRTLLLVQQRGRWWFTRQSASAVTPGALQATLVGGQPALLGWVGNTLRLLFGAASFTNETPWLAITKLWDAGEPLLDKEALLAGIAAVVGGASPTGITLSVTTEYTQLATAAAQSTGDAGKAGYQWFYATSVQAGGKYLGLQAVGDTNTSEVRLLALQAQADREW
jgi:hypothetical protein